MKCAECGQEVPAKKMPMKAADMMKPMPKPMPKAKMKAKKVVAKVNPFFGKA